MSGNPWPPGDELSCSTGFEPVADTRLTGERTFSFAPLDLRLAIYGAGEQSKLAALSVLP